jgi:hypothetical protein
MPHLMVFYFFNFFSDKSTLSDVMKFSLSMKVSPLSSSSELLPASEDMEPTEGVLSSSIYFLFPIEFWFDIDLTY